MIAISAFFDVSDYESPIKYFMDDVYFSLVHGISIAGQM